MKPLSQELLQALSSTFQIRDRRPSCAVFVYHPITNERMRVDRVISVDTDQRFDSPAHEFNFVADNTGGWLTPDYSWSKFKSNLLFDRGVGTEDGNPWPGVIRPNTKVEIWFGYGKYLVKRMTGLIDGYTIAADGKTISVKGRSMYKRVLVETVKTTGLTKKITYKNKSLRYIVEDIHDRLGLPIQAEEIYVYGTNQIYMVPELEIERGSTWDSAISSLIESSYARIYSDVDGTTILKPVRIYSQDELEDFVLHEAVNLTQLEYNSEDFDINGNLIIKYSDKVMSAFEDKYLRNTVLQGQFREEVIDAPWCNTYEKRRQYALSRFRKYKMKLRSLTVGCVGHPGIELYDLCRVYERISQSTAKYCVKSIRTSFSEQGYFDLMDLELAL